MSGAKPQFRLKKKPNVRDKKENYFSASTLVLFAFGLILAILLAEVALRLLGHAFLQDHSVDKGSARNPSAVRILALGESTTQFLDGSSWPLTLEEILNSRCNASVKVYNEGISGTTSTFIVYRLPSQMEKYDPDIVIAMMGINDNGLSASIPKQGTLHFVAEHSRLIGLLRWAIGGKDEGYAWPASFEKAENIQTEIDEGLKEWKDFYVDAEEMRSKGYGEVLQLAYDLDIDSALKKLSEVETNETLHLSHEIRGDILSLGSPELSLEEYEKSLSLRYTPRIQFKMAAYYMRFGELNKSEAMYLLGLQKDPNNVRALGDLASLQLSMGKYSQSEENYRKTMEFEVPDSFLYRETKNMLQAGIPPDEIKAFYRRLGYNLNIYKDAKDSVITRENRNRMQQIIAGKGALLIAMQYPTYSLGDLEGQFDDPSNVLFVGNEDNFRKELAERPYEEVFTDRFGGSFGHATAFGNRLIAENVANAIARSSPSLECDLQSHIEQSF
jgi:lysophospholipase L1-like esterase